MWSAVPPEAVESATDDGRRNAEFDGGPLAGPPLAPKGFGPANDVPRSRMAQLVRPGGSIPQTGDTFCTKACVPFCGGLRANAEGCGRSLRRLPVPPDRMDNLLIDHNYGFTLAMCHIMLPVPMLGLLKGSMLCNIPKLSSL